MKLLSDTQMAGVRKIGLLGMTSTVTVRKFVFDDENPLSDDEHKTSTVDFDTVGWLYSPASAQIEEISGMAAIANDYRLFLPVGTDINVRDHVLIGGNEFVANDVSDEDTWQAMLHVRLVRLV